MTEQAKKYLSDISQAIDLIENFIADATSYNQFSEDLETLSAVERQIDIIGEAVNKLEKLTPQVKVDNGGKIHSYDYIDPSVIWAIVTNHLTPLNQEINALLR